MAIKIDKPDPEVHDIAPGPSSWRRPWLEYAVLFAVALAGLELKKPFGLVLHHVMRTPEQAPSVYTWLSGDTVSLALVALACLLHARSALPASPWLEKRFFKGPQERLSIWQPGIQAGFICIGVFFVSQFVQAQLGIAMPLGTQLNSGAVSHGDIMRLCASFPLAVIGAPLSEEMVFRFAILSILLGLASFARPGPAARVALFWVANLAQAIWFGFGHVHEGLVAGQAGSIILATITAQQTWAALVFGYVFRRFGIETAMVAHFTIDLLSPLALIFALMAHH
jgi:membrane protease YdiL (CAAX protease family)